jgi:hypothetical protein
MFNDLILLTGSPRSGTTWLAKIFDSHPQTLYFHEPDSLLRNRDIPRLIEPAAVEDYRESLQQYIDALLRMNGVKVRGKDPVFPKTYLSGAGYALHRLSVLTAKAFSRWGNRFPVLTPLSPTRPQRRVWKSIEAAGRQAAIARCFPGVKVVYIVRHPCGYVASVLRGKRIGSFESDYDPGRDLDIMRPLLQIPLARRHGLSLEQFRELSPVARMTWRWVLMNEQVLTDLATLPNCRVIRYEDLCIDTIAQAKQLFSFTGLDWNRQTEDFLTASTTTASKRYYGVFRESKQAAESWRDELAPAVIDEVMGIVAGTRSGELYPAARVAG